MASLAQQDSVSRPERRKLAHFSVYQAEGQPLSEEAIYRSKLKNGGHTVPSSNSYSGVDAGAPDTAALLAVNSDLSVHPYQRHLSAEAAIAALSANHLSSTPSSSPREPALNGSSYRDAESAAILVKNHAATPHVTNRSSSSLSRQSSNSLSSVYLSSAKNGSPKPARSFNIDAINKAANQQAASRLGSRLQPATKISSNGLGKRPADVTEQNSSMSISRITARARDSARRELESRLSEKQVFNGIPTPSDTASKWSKLASQCATASNATGKLPDYASDERKTLEKNTLVSLSVLAAATSRVEEKMKQMDRDTVSRIIFSNPELNEKAMAAAKEWAAKFTKNAGGSKAIYASGKNYNSDEAEINLGGGLFMKASEITAMANSLVKPALEEIEKNSDHQRKLDARNLVVLRKIKKREVEHKNEIRQSKEQEKKVRETEVEKRREELEGMKGDINEDQEKLLEEQKKALEEKNAEFDAQVAEEEKQKKELDDERDEKLKVIADAKAEKDAEREKEATDLQEEKKKDLAPILADLEKETKILDELTKNREEKEAFFNEQKARDDKATEELASADHKLAKLTEQLERIEREQKEAASKAVEDVAAAASAKAAFEKTAAEKNSKLEELGKERSVLEGRISSSDKERVDLISKLNEQGEENHTQAVQINEILPEHLQKEVPAFEKVKDNLDKSKFAVNDDPIEEPSEVESEPEDVPEKIWSEQDEKAEKEAEMAEKEKLAKAVTDETIKQSVREQKKDGMFTGFLKRSKKLVLSPQATSSKSAEKKPSPIVKKEAAKETKHKKGVKGLSGKRLIKLFNEPAAFVEKKHSPKKISVEKAEKPVEKAEKPVEKAEKPAEKASPTKKPSPASVKPESKTKEVQKDSDHATKSQKDEPEGDNFSGFSQDFVHEEK